MFFFTPPPPPPAACTPPHARTQPWASAGVESGAGDSKENRQQAGNAVPAPPHPAGRSRRSGQSSDLEQGKRLSTKAAASKTRRSARLSDTQTSSSSAEQDSVRGAAALDPERSIGQVPIADAQVAMSQASSTAQPATQDPHDQGSIAEPTVSQVSALTDAVSHESPAVTPVKAPQAAKSSGDFHAGVKSCSLTSCKPFASANCVCCNHSRLVHIVLEAVATAH